MDQRAHFFGEVAIAKGFATQEQVLEALKEQYRLRCAEKRHLFLGEVMVHLGMISLDQLVELMDESAGYHETPTEQRQKVFFGDIAVRKGYVTPMRLFQCLQQQRDEDASGFAHRLIGEIMLDNGYLTPAELEEVISTVVELGYADYRTGYTPSEGTPLDAFIPAGAEKKS
ncbi:MAG TPA: hypothetical protein VFF73_15690 [Planctomycetota bacterium]|nr:hypothetical protein [Planctomycetota bacterium]